MVNQHLHMPAPLLRKNVPDLSSAVEHVIFTALAKDPQKRFSSITAFIQALQSAYSGGYSPVVAQGVVSLMPPAYPVPFFAPSGAPRAQQAVFAPALPVPASPGLAIAVPALPVTPAPVQYAPASPVSYPQYQQVRPATPVTPPASAQPAPARKAKSNATISRRAIVAGLLGVA